MFLMGFHADRPRSADAVRIWNDAMAEAQLTAKDVYSALGMSQSQFAKISRGESGLYLPSLERLIEDLPYAMWVALLPKIACLLYKRFLRSAAESTAAAQQQRSA